MADDNTTAEWQGPADQPDEDTTAEDHAPEPAAEDTATDEIAALKAELEKAQAANSEMKWENVYRESFAASGLPEGVNDIVRELLDGATVEQITPTITALSKFAAATRPAPIAHKVPLEQLRSGVGDIGNIDRPSWAGIISNRNTF